MHAEALDVRPMLRTTGKSFHVSDPVQVYSDTTQRKSIPDLVPKEDQQRCERRRGKRLTRGWYTLWWDSIGVHRPPSFL